MVGLISQFDTFLIDCDGVLWNGDKVIEGIAETIELMRKEKKRIVFVTNNSTKSREEYKKKFLKMNIEIESLDEIMSSAFVAGLYLAEMVNLKVGAKVFVIGSAGLIEEISMRGFQVVSTHNSDVDAVVVGFDSKFDYEKLTIAHPTNDDSTYPSEDGEMPGTGCLVAYLEKCSGRQATVLGKPHNLMLKCIDSKFPLKDKSKICMIGDRLETDILFGKNNGFKTMLVLSGVHSEKDVEVHNIVPDYIIPSLASIATRFLEEA